MGVVDVIIRTLSNCGFYSVHISCLNKAVLTFYFKKILRDVPRQDSVPYFKKFGRCSLLYSLLREPQCTLFYIFLFKICILFNYCFPNVLVREPCSRNTYEYPVEVCSLQTPVWKILPAKVKWESLSDVFLKLRHLYVHSIFLVSHSSNFIKRENELENCSSLFVTNLGWPHTDPIWFSQLQPCSASTENSSSINETTSSTPHLFKSIKSILAPLNLLVPVVYSKFP